MNELQIFTYHDTPIRTTEREDGLWWVLADVCKALNIANTGNVASRLDNDEKGVHLVDTPSGTQKMTVVNEPGLYNVILRSDKPEAKSFKRWVTHEVLPSIRSRGSYALPAQQPMTPAQLLAAQAQVLVEIESRQNALEAQSVELIRQTAALEMKVENAVKVFSRPAEDHWKSDMDRAVKDLAAQTHNSNTNLRGKLYSELERRANVDVDARLRNLRKRKKKAGMRYRDAMELTKLDAIAADKALRAIFEAIVREWQAKAV